MERIGCGCAVALLLCLALGVFSCWPAAAFGEATHYPVLYRDGAKPLALGRTTYTVSPERQEVVSKTGTFLGRYQKCVVVDAASWECKYDDGSATFGFRDGAYFEEIREESVPRNTLRSGTRSVSRLDWWTANLFRW